MLLVVRTDQELRHVYILKLMVFANTLRFWIWKPFWILLVTGLYFSLGVGNLYY